MDVMCFLTSPRLTGRGRIAFGDPGEGQGTALIHMLHLRAGEPLTPTLSPQVRGEGEESYPKYRSSTPR
jgi:hypothetical protein